MFHDERYLWKAFQQGEVRAFKVLYERYASTLISYGNRLSSDHELVQDLVQDVFVDIWTHRVTLQNLETIKYYLFKVLRNKLSKAHQRTTHFIQESQLPPPDADLFSPSIETLIIEQEASTQHHAQLQNAICQLPDRQREAIMLAFYHDFSNEEIAGIMGINHQSVINHLNRALSSLRGLLARLHVLLFLASQLI